MAADVYTLASLSITTALTSSAQTAITGLDGMTGVTLEFQWGGGAGGSTVVAVAQTSFDGGTTWRDIARADFTTTAAVKYVNLSGLLSKAVTAYATLSSEGVFDGILGDQLRVVVTSTGTFTGSGGTLAIRASVR